jgi:putative heme-binding domain-containing protein
MDRHGRPSRLSLRTPGGSFGFAPTDAAVGPDGSLFISVGGRGTAGGVFRIVHDEGLKTLTAGTSESADTAEEMTLDEVLTANQPLSAWSRKRWLPAARRLGAAPFRQAAIDERRQTTERVRAIEILVEVFGEPDSSTATVLASAGAAGVRARLAWAVGRLNPESPAQDIISRLLVDRDPIVQRIALEALVGVSDSAALTAFLPGIARGLTAEDRHTRLAAASLVQQLSQPQVAALRLQLQSSPAGQVWLAIGQQLRPVSVSIAAATTAVNVVVDSATPAALRADALRLLQLSLGDVGPGEGRDAVFDSYGTPLDLRPYESRLNPLLAELFETFPSGQPLFDSEMVRMIAVTSPYNRVLFGKVLAQITPESRPADDVHRLIALARFEIERSFEETTATARALLNVDVKIRKAGLRQDSNWDDRIGELYKALCSVDPALPQLLVEQPEFGEPGHVLYMDRVPQPQVELAIQKFVQRIADDDSFGWTNDVVFLIGESKTPQHLELLIEQLENLAVRDAVLIVLAESPRLVEREVFVSGLESSQLNAVKACANALKKLPRSSDAAEQFALLSAARRLINDEPEFKVRELIMRLLQNNTGQANGFVFGKDGHLPQPDAMRAWQEYLEARYPEFRPVTADDITLASYSVIQQVNWDSGDAAAGKLLFEKLSCAKCHGGRKALGPDLTGVAKRFSREDLFAAIVEPDRDVSSRYQTTTVVTIAGKVYSGLVVYRSVDGLLLRDAEQNTYRFEEAEIESQQKRRTSLMPAGLLKNVEASQIADLYQYLRSL